MVFAGLAYLAVVAFTGILASYRFPIPYAVPIFDTPFALVGLGVAYLCLERHRLRQDVQSAALGATLWMTGLLALAHIFTQPDYPGTPGVHAGVAPYFFALSYLGGFVGIALATHFGRRPLPLSDRARYLIAAGLVGLAFVIVIGVVQIRPAIPSLVMPPGRWTPFALTLATPIIGAAAVWALVASSRRARDPEAGPFAGLFLLTALVWTIGLAGFLLYPYRYSVPWYVGGLARPIGVLFLFVGLIREQVGLYREARARLRDLEQLHGAGQALVTSLDAAQIVETIAAQAVRVSGAAGAILFRLDEEAQVVRAVARAGGISAELVRDLELPVGQGASGLSVARRQPVWSADLQDDAALPFPAEVRDRMRRDGLKAVAAVPLAMKAGETFGALSVFYREARSFTDADLELLGAFGAQASVALENARAFEHLATKAGHDAGLQEFAQRVLEATGEAAIRATAVRFAMSLLGADYVALFSADPKASELKMDSGLGWGPGVVGAVSVTPSHESFAGYAFLHKTTIQVEDLANEHRFSIPGYLSEHGVRAGIVVPIGVRQEPVGILAAYYRRPHRFSDEESRVLTALAQETALALDKARLYAELQENLERLQETQAQLMQADKLKALGTLLSGMAHELNNPLSTIQLSVQLMKRQAAVPEPLRKRLDAMEEECDRASRIIRDLLVFARRKPPERRLTDVSEVIRASLALHGPDFDLSKVRVSTELDAAPPILADAHQLQQVLLNLFANATHAMRAHGGGGRLHVRASAQDGEIVVHVDDDGPGIPDDDLGRIFDPFFTTKAAGEGTGLGLSLSIGIIEAHGGRMTAENLPEGGARFTLRLPIGETTETAAPAKPAARGASAARARVLVVDDEDRLRGILVEVLTSLGHQVDEAPSGIQAIERLRAGAYELVMLDLRLPDVDGRGVWEWVRTHTPERAARVVFMTGDTMSGDTQRFLAESGRPVLTKPLSIDRVRAIVDEILAATR
ncbi:MAG TPA: GAF domain-containing protein [Terriglobales bacterium]|nr:GAF domain-containing protein [Terriglobales bacterium]